MKESRAKRIDEHVGTLHSMESGMKMGMGGKMMPAGSSKHSTPAGRNFAPGKAVDGSSLGGAVDELYHQHPHNWNDLGPHHHGKENEVHEPHPYDGLKPKTMGAGKSPAINSKG